MLAPAGIARESNRSPRICTDVPSLVNSRSELTNVTDPLDSFSSASSLGAATSIVSDPSDEAVGVGAPGAGALVGKGVGLGPLVGVGPVDPDSLHPRSGAFP